MNKKIFIGTINQDKGDVWTFDTSEHSFDGTVCEAIDQMLGYTTKDGEKYCVTIEKL